MGEHHHHHRHHHHAHGSKNHNAGYKKLWLAILLVFGFAVIEALGGWLSRSLALLSDAGHMLSDGFALILATFAAWVAMKPPSKQHSYGFGRAEILAAWFSSLLLLAISAMIIVEAISRIHHPPQNIHSVTVLWIASIGIIINLLVAWVLSRGEKNLNMRAALLHVLSDLLASFAALISGAVIYTTKWLLVDPVLSILIGIIIMVSSLRLLREAILILMEGVPAHISINEVEKSLQQIAGVTDIHDLHIWTLASGKVALSAHVDIPDLSLWKNVLSDIKKMLDNEFKIKHVTLQPEPEIIDCQPCNGK
ncbi:MAG: cation transporter [Coxiella sp. RIFCSPHIGHO2_12_FULL_42_15]|nr:MAG: cation transporter [Coxiella sp. RIFCSPHIGHO2_12_FULL_42_15]